ncbi:MAG: bacteriohemerythrin [Salinivirgaceae bacterium]
MAFITWNKDLSVKIDSIDDQHKKLIELINDFYENIKNRSNDESISKLLRGMNKYTVEHFNVEEELMKKYGYPDIEAHKKEHDKFVAKVTELEEKFNNGKVIVSFEITSFLKDWWKNHIQVVDQKYSDFFIKSGLK